MSGRNLKRISYLLREKNKKTADVKKCKLEELHSIEQLNKHEIGLKSCSVVEKCITKAQEKKFIENAFKNLTASKEYSIPSMFSKFQVIICLNNT